MTTQYLLTKDIAGYNGFGLEPTDTIFSATLVTDTNTTLTVPETFNLGSSSSTKNVRMIAIIKTNPSATVWFSLNNTAAIPSGGTFATSNSILINGFFPVGYVVKAGDVMNFFTSGTDTNDISVEFYWIQS